MRNIKNVREKRRGKIRARVKGVGKRPRVVVFRSNKNIYVQAVDDEKRVTVAAESDLKMKKNDGKRKAGHEVGQKLAERLMKKGIKEGVFDRAGYRYHGRIKEVCEGLRKKGLKI